MASVARSSFDKNCQDVDRLLAIHRDLTGTLPGRRRQVEVLNKSAIILLTAFWEAYCEDIAAEGLARLVSGAPDSRALPKELQKKVAKSLKEHANELAVWDLADQGWRTVLTSRLAQLQQDRNRRLNTPKSDLIDALFLETLGIDRISGRWFWRGMSAAQARDKLDKYVTLRGEVAHRGAAASSVKKTHVTDYYEHVKKLVGRTGGRVNAVVKRATGSGLW